MDATVHEDGILGKAGLSPNLWCSEVFTVLDVMFVQQCKGFIQQLNYLENSHAASLIGVSNHLLANQICVGGGHGGNPGLNLKFEGEQIRRARAGLVLLPVMLLPLTRGQVLYLV